MEAITNQVLSSGEPKDRIIVALDTDNLDTALALVTELAPQVGRFKIGLEFITTMLAKIITAKTMKEAVVIARKIRKLFKLLAGDVFWDGKFADIPNTVGAAAKVVAGLRVRMFNVHASAGQKAVEAAVANKGGSLVLGVTVLTSIGKLPDGSDECVSIFGRDAPAKVLQFARMLVAAKADGVICSPQELSVLHDLPLIKITPGIRAADAPPDDQRRTMTAAEAIRKGADWLVVGRPITGAPDPAEAAKKIAEEIAAALRERSAPPVARLNEQNNDAPSCPDCGHKTVPNGAAFKCLICGASVGTS